MKRPVKWTDRAVDELRRQVLYVRKSSPASALLVRDRVLAAIKSLSAYQTGRTGRVEDTFELLVPKTSLIVFYAFESDGTLRILRIIHAARDFRVGQWPDEN